MCRTLKLVGYTAWCKKVQFRSSCSSTEHQMIMHFNRVVLIISLCCPLHKYQPRKQGNTSFLAFKMEKIKLTLIFFSFFPSALNEQGQTESYQLSVRWSLSCGSLWCTYICNRRKQSNKNSVREGEFFKKLFFSFHFWSCVSPAMP